MFVALVLISAVMFIFCTEVDVSIINTIGEDLTTMSSLSPKAKVVADEADITSFKGLSD